MKKSIFLLLFLIVIVGGILRFFHISTNPPGLYVDEVSIGLNAYDVLTTGKDQYGIPHPLTFLAFGEYKMPVYIYMVSGAMALFGKNEFAIRFPSAFFGTVTIAIFFLLVWQLLRKHTSTKKHAEIIALISATLLAISTWHIHFSRAGFEATVALFFYTLTLYLFLIFLQRKHFVFLLSAVISLVITFYTYDGYRVLVPLTALFGFFIGFLQRPLKKQISIAGVIFLLFSLPLLLFTFSSGGLMRFHQTSAFAAMDYTNMLQKYSEAVIIFVKNYLSYFSLTYLFRFGDQINRHQIQGFGLLYMWQLLYIFLGVYFLKNTANKSLRWIVLLLLLVEPIAPAFTQPSPHTLRFLYGVIPYTLLVGLGLYQLLLEKKKYRIPILAVTVVAAGISLCYYLHYYYIHYSNDALYDWGKSCKEVAYVALQNQQKGMQIFVDTSLPCVNDYFAFYTPQLHVIETPENGIPEHAARAMLITSSDKNKNKVPGLLQQTIVLPNLNHDTFAQFWKL